MGKDKHFFPFLQKTAEIFSCGAEIFSKTAEIFSHDFTQF